MLLDELAAYRKDAIQAAKDFMYGTLVIDKLKIAKSIDEISVIMSKARAEMYKDVDIFPESVAKYDERVSRESDKNVKSR